jgi:hypothetical protein
MKDRIMQILQQSNIRTEHEQQDSGLITQYLSSYTASKMADQLIELFKDEYKRHEEAKEQLRDLRDQLNRK